MVTAMKLKDVYSLGFPGGSESKESTCNVGDLGSIPGLGRSPEGGHVNPFQSSWLEVYNLWVHRVRHDWTIKHSTAYIYIHTYTHIYIYIHIHTYIDIYAHTYKEEYVFWVHESSIPWRHHVLFGFPQCLPQ